MREAQIETVRLWIDHRYTIVLKARQIGFSTLAAAYAFWLAFFWPDRFIVMLSRTEREAVKLLAKAKYGYKALPKWMKERGPAETSNNQLKLTFSNESAIESLPSGNDPARGESVYLVVVDEMAFLPNSEEAWASIEPIADVGGRVITLSTANGSGNFFHKQWLGAEQGINLFKPIFWPWSAGDRDEEWYESKKRTMPDWQLHQEYPSNPDEAFIRSGNPVFDVDALRAMLTAEPDRGYVTVLSRKNSEFRPSAKGEFAVWEFRNPNSVYCLGADVAEGLEFGDFSSVHVINASSGLVAAHWHGHIDPDLFGELCAEIGWMYGNCLVGIEVNNHGLTTLKAAQRYGYKNLYRTRRLGQRTPDATEALGWRTTAQSKPLAIDELARSLRDGAMILKDEHTISELRTFVRDANGKTHGSPFDDRVMSLAIANQMLKYVWLPEYTEEKTLVPYSGDWWEKKLAVTDSPRPRIGSLNVRSQM